MWFRKKRDEELALYRTRALEFEGLLQCAAADLRLLPPPAKEMVDPIVRNIWAGLKRVP